MHIINSNKKNIHTDLILDISNENELIYNKNNIMLFRSNIDEKNYSTIKFIDITDKDQFKYIEELLIKELSYYIKGNKILIIGLGNRKSTPDSLGPKVIDNVLVTRHLFDLGDVESGYKNVSIFEPGVFGTTGISSIDIIKKVVDIVKPDTCIIIDSLCTNNISRLNKTIQITNSGIHPGSGVFNDRGELSNNTLNCEVIAIGIPTVINLEEVSNNLIVTPKEIDYIIDKSSLLLSMAINKSLHNSYQSTK